jgi:hypothetical protein
MTIAERIFAEVRSLPERQARAVLAFVSSLKARRSDSGSSRPDMSVFDQFGAVYDGSFNRDELYDRKVLR